MAADPVTLKRCSGRRAYERSINSGFLHMSGRLFELMSFIFLRGHAEVPALSALSEQTWSLREFEH